MSFAFENRVGRLLEVKIEASMTAEEAQQFRTRMFLALSKIEGRGVLLGDLRSCQLFSGDVSEKLITMLQHDSPKVERTAFLVHEGAFAAQVERMVADAARAAEAAGRRAPPRRAFRDWAAARAWLAETLNAEERARLDEIFRGI